jgi:processive 1,2-diacylglycerol beta-glucosyltransferase
VILVLTAGFGDGHNTAAHSVAQALQTHQSPTTDAVLVIDLFEQRLPLLTKILQTAYQAAIVNFPGAWKWVYQKLADGDVGQQTNLVNDTLQNGLTELISRHQPSALVSTYPFYSTLLAPLREKGPVPPLFTVITDSVSVHPGWTNDPSEFYCVADHETSAVLHERGLPAEKIFVTGFPVSPAFAEPLSPPRSADSAQSILYLPSTPVKHVAATLEALRPLILSGVHLTLPVGKHKSRLHLAINRFADSVPEDRFTLIGWTDQMPNLLRSHDLVICKAGGAILHEVLAARTPAVIDYVVPGQEEGNAEMLLKNRCALRSHTPTETAEAVTRMLANQASLAREMRGRMIPPLSMPNAAHLTAQAVLNHL